MAGRNRPRPSGEPHEAARRGEFWWSSLVALGWVIAALYLTQVASLPRALRQDLDDTAAHGVLGVLVAGCLLCVVRAVGWQGRRLLVVGLFATVVSMVFLIGTELLQGTSPARQPQLSDAMADVAGASIAALLLLGAFRCRAPFPRMAATGFLTLASVGLCVVAGLIVANPRDPVREPLPATLETSALSDVPCRSELAIVERAIDDNPGADRRPRQPTVEPLLRFDLTQGFDRVEGSLAPLRLVPVGPVGFEPGLGAVFDGGGAVLSSEGAAEELLGALATSEGFSVDVWIELDDDDQSGPARIVSLAAGTGRNDSIFHLGVEGTKLSVRLRSGCDPTNWVLIDGLPPGAHHVALTYDQGSVLVFINGGRRASYRLEGADLKQWSSTSVPLNIGNERSQDRGLRGKVSVVSFWPVAVSADEVAWLASQDERAAVEEP